MCCSMIQLPKMNYQFTENIRKMMRFCYDSDVRGYHVYKDIWETSHGELLNCERETRNTFDPFGVCIKKHDDKVGHVPKKISDICSLFLQRGGRIQCEITGTRQYSRDIPQGGLEIPCDGALMLALDYPD